MTDTIKGGAYQNPDGTWVNAQGKRIPPPAVDTNPTFEDVPVVITTTDDEYASPSKPVQPPLPPVETLAQRRERIKAEKAAKKKAAGR